MRIHRRIKEFIHILMLSRDRHADFLLPYLALLLVSPLVGMARNFLLHLDGCARAQTYRCTMHTAYRGSKVLGGCGSLFHFRQVNGSCCLNHFWLEVSSHLSLGSTKIVIGRTYPTKQPSSQCYSNPQPFDCKAWTLPLCLSFSSPWLNYKIKMLYKSKYVQI